MGMLTFLVVIGILYFIAAAFIREDAIARGENGNLWFAIVAVGGVFGILFYVLKLPDYGSRRVKPRIENAEKISCTYCTQDNNPKREYCITCKTELSKEEKDSNPGFAETRRVKNTEKILCPNCSQINDTSRLTCKICTTELKSEPASRGTHK